MSCDVIIDLKHDTNNIKKWNLIWKEDFKGKTLDSIVWSNMKRRMDQSRKYHSSNQICYELKNNKLILRGIKNPDLLTDTAKFLTGAITTEGKKAFTPPLKIEIKAKLGVAQGAWPAFWLLPYQKEKGWPADGEIDIMEHLNYDNFIFQTVHSSYTKHNPITKPQRSVKVPIKPNDFNIYAVEILDSYLRFYVNGNETLTYPKVDSLSVQGQYPFFRDLYLMIDMQLGGSWPGHINASDLPIEMEIDWVKYFKPK